jgi:hypothetical protein
MMMSQVYTGERFSYKKKVAEAFPGEDERTRRSDRWGNYLEPILDNMSIPKRFVGSIDRLIIARKLGRARPCWRIHKLSQD